MRRLFRLILALILGYYFTEWWRNQPRPVETSSKPTSVPVKRVASVPAKKTVDPLVELDGIGPVFERALNAIGIFSFAELAQQHADELAEKMPGVRITAARIKKDRWIEQAGERAASLISSSTPWSANDGKSS